MPETKPIGPDQGPEPCCDRRTAEVLELPQLLDRVASLAMSRPGARRVRALAPSGDLALVQRRLRRLAQLRELVAESSRPGLHAIHEIEPILAQVRVDGAAITPLELETAADFLAAVGAAENFLAPSQERFDELHRLYNRITPLPELARSLRKIIGPGHTVASSASPELARARREIGRARDRLQAQLSRLVNDQDRAAMFSDSVVTQRAGRFVVPVKVEAKSRLAGIIHDTSATGATCFMEPLEAVEANNQLAMMRQKEREEERRVLAEAARMLAAQLPVLHENLQSLAKLDCLLAQARFCERLEAVSPRTALGGELVLNRARHPLLAWREITGGSPAVPITVEMAGDLSALIISGANAGGKTAALKTVGLITLMVMCGMQAPVDRHSRVPVFAKIMADVGDEQDLQGELSTFTAHAGRLAAMARRADQGALILIDELGASTDPGEGSALGMALLDHLARRGAKALVTTHYHRLKAYGAANASAQNVAVAFDRTTGRPTYQLHYGQAGFSDALAVSRGLGFPPGLVDAAEGYLEDSERTTAALLKEAQQSANKARAELDQARAANLAAKADRENARRELADARRQRAGALGEGKRRVREVAARMQKRMEEITGRLENQIKAGEKPKVGRVRQEIYQAKRQALGEVEAAVAPPAAPRPGGGAPFASLKAGDRVTVASLGQSGVLLEDLDPAMDSVAVSVGVAGVRVMVSSDEVSMEPGGDKPPAAPQVKVAVTAEAGDGLDLNLVGMTVDEALPLVDKALDQAILAGRKSINVIHGVGTGRLRHAVRDYLVGHPYVVNAGPGVGRSSGATTVAELRD